MRGDACASPNLDPESVGIGEFLLSFNQQQLMWDMSQNL
jgi:hypothetical protein